MEYPLWHMGGVSTSLFIALVSVLHVFVAQFAVGGGLFLVWQEYRAHRQQSPALLQWLEKHTQFFVLLSMVFGGLSGVGIWFTMTVVSPAGSVLLSHIFLFFWAIEWLFFLIEIVSLLIYKQTYSLCREGKMAPRVHMIIGAIYAISGYMSLVTINGIISFMMTPGDGFVTGNVWVAFFNPGYFPSLVYRTALCLILAGMFALVTAPRIADPQARREAVRSSARWIIFPLFALLASSFWYFSAMPLDRQQAILRRTVDIQPFVLAYGWILPVVFLAGVVVFVQAERFRAPLGALVLCAGLILSGSFEWIRETGRRPWLVPGYMYSNGLTVGEEAQANAEGVMALSGWAALAAHEPGGQGKFLFAQQCGICHGVGAPRMDMVSRAGRLSAAGLLSQLQGQGQRLDYMAPMFGNHADRLALAAYLYSLALDSEEE